MTDPKLREARIAEAKRRAEANIHNGRYDEGLAHHLIDLIEQDWRPEPEVDAVTLAEREFLKAYAPWSASAIDIGAWDHSAAAKAFRAGHANGQANHPDTRRMDWLDSANVVVDRGGVFFVHVSTDSDPLRAKIDRAMEGGQ